MIRWGTEQAGLISIADEDERYGWWVLHIGVWLRYWTWGYGKTWYDGPIYTLGFGPLFYFAWQPWELTREAMMDYRARHKKRAA